MFAERGNFELMEIQISKWFQGARKKNHDVSVKQCFLNKKTNAKKLTVRNKAESTQFACRNN